MRPINSGIDTSDTGSASISGAEALVKSVGRLPLAIRIWIMSLAYTKVHTGLRWVYYALCDLS
jgi:hypothetical protein